MKLNIKNTALVGLAFAALTACQFEEVPNPNAPSVEDATANPGLAELNNLVVGAESSMRNGIGGYTTSVGVVAREFYVFDADPRNTEDLLGKNGTNLDNNTFYTTGPWNSRYRCVKSCNLILEAADVSDAISTEEAQGYRGFANTIKALQLLLLINHQDENGIRLDVADPANLGPIVSDKGQVLTAIATLLDDAAAQLDAAGTEFAFGLSQGFAGFDTPATFKLFNRALRARVALYQEDWSGALSALDQSFFDLNGDLTVGPKYFFSTNANDLVNPMFKAPNQNGDQIVVHDSFIADAEAGDLRVANKTAARDNPSVQDGLTGTHETRLYSSQSEGIDIIRNEELVLIYAEASAQQTSPINAVAGIDVIRSSAGLDPYAGGIGTDALIDEILHQRRYSLWGEAHRMIDLRRYDRLNNTYVPIDRANDQIFQRFPIPLNEL